MEINNGVSTLTFTLAGVIATGCDRTGYAHRVLRRSWASSGPGTDIPLFSKGSNVVLLLCSTRNETL
jgi:hypothetical protein